MNRDECVICHKWTKAFFNINCHKVNICGECSQQIVRQEIDYLYEEEKA